MRKTLKYRISPTKETERKLCWTLTRCRELYNAALSERRDAYTYAGKSISYYDQQNELPEIKREIRQEYRDIAAHVLQDVLRRLDKAFQNFFRRCKNGEHPGYPRFQGRNRYASFTYPDGAGWKFDGQHLHLSKIGKAKVILHRPLEGKIKTVTIKREVDEWYVTFSCRCGMGKLCEHLYCQGSMGRTATHQSLPQVHLASLLTVWARAQKGLVRALAFL